MAMNGDDSHGASPGAVAADVKPATFKLRTLDDTGNYEHPLYQLLERGDGLSVGLAVLDDLLAWGLEHSLWVFPMATSCCGIELMAAAGSRVDLDRMGTIIRASPRQADVMVVAGTITVKMAPRVKKLWEQMPEPKWCIAMGSCAISGDFYRNLYPTVPGIDTFLPVDVYIPGCPPNPESLMHGLLRLKERIEQQRRGTFVAAEKSPVLLEATKPSIPSLGDVKRPAGLDRAQEASAENPTDAEETAPLVVPELARAVVDDVIQTSETSSADAVIARFGGVDGGPQAPPIVPRDRHVDLAIELKRLGFVQYVTTVATHWNAATGRKGKEPTETEHLEVTVVLRSVGKGAATATWSVRVAPGESVPTLANVFAGAEWQEREQFDLLGVPFAGHPDLRRLMLPENATFHPLRRDFPADAHWAPWR